MAVRQTSQRRISFGLHSSRSSSSTDHKEPVPAPVVKPLGVARLERCQYWRAHYLVSLGNAITECAQHHSEDVQAQVQEALSCLGWMVDHHALPQDHVVETTLESLYSGMKDGNVPQSLLEDIGQAMQAHVFNVLNEARKAAKGPPVDVHANAWSLALAELLVDANGVCDAGPLQPIIEKLLTLDQWSWLPEDHRGDFLRQIENLFKEPGVWERLDRMSNTSPLPPSVQALVNLRSWPDAMPLKRMLWLSLMQTLLTAPLQYEGTCWLVSPNRAIHFDLDAQLTLLDDLLQTGAFQFHGPGGEKYGVAPDPYPNVVMSLATHPKTWEVRRDKSEGPGPGAICTTQACAKATGEIVKALQAVLPKAKSDEEWRRLVTETIGEVWSESACGTFTLRAVIDRVIAEHVGLPVRYLDGVVQPSSDKFRQLRDLQRELSRACFIAWGAQYVPPLAMAWHSAISKGATGALLKSGWRAIDGALRQAMQGKTWPLRWNAQRLNAQFAQLREAFLSRATLILDHDVSQDEAMFRLCIKPGTDGPSTGRGSPVGNARELIAWLEDLSRQAVKGQDTLDPRDAQVWLSHVSLALQSPQFLAAVERRPGPKDKKPAPGMWLLSTGFWGRGDLGAVPREDGGFAPDHVHNPHGRNETFDLHVGSKKYAAATSGAWARRTSAQGSLENLIQKERWLLQGGAFPEFDFQRHLDKHDGVVVAATDRSQRKHRFFLTPKHPSVQGALDTSLSPKEWIRLNLKKPMNAMLKQKLTPEEAKAWLKAVLEGSQLKPNSNIEALVAELWRTTYGDAVPSKGCTRQALLPALKRLAASKPAINPFQFTDTRRNGLELAVVNAMPGQPWAQYAHNNAHENPVYVYFWNPWTAKIEHGCATERLLGPNQRDGVIRRFDDDWYRW